MMRHIPDRLLIQIQSPVAERSHGTPSNLTQSSQAVRFKKNQLKLSVKHFQTIPDTCGKKETLYIKIQEDVIANIWWYFSFILLYQLFYFGVNFLLNVQFRLNYPQSPICHRPSWNGGDFLGGLGGGLVGVPIQMINIDYTDYTDYRA